MDSVKRAEFHGMYPAGEQVSSVGLQNERGATTGQTQGDQLALQLSRQCLFRHVQLHTGFKKLQKRLQNRKREVS